VTAVSSPNFAFLAVHDAQLVRLGADAERFFPQDPDVSLIRLRQYGERLAQRAAALSGLYTASAESQLDLLRRLQDGRLISLEVAQLFHSLRKGGQSGGPRPFRGTPPGPAASQGGA
jgi:type I restriction enzyme R subunit